MSALAYGASAVVLLAGLCGVVFSRDLLHLVVCLSITQSSTYVLLLAVGYRSGATAPVFSDHPKGPVVDPVVQALALTDVVVGATVFALLLALVIQAAKRADGDVDPDALSDLHG
ncbi:MAG TPA: cation:proton antiporter subunit C [Mycobacteriales bacterium]|nr:cation:proton antiporter subunit C [Mycobacteriales bacterium]